MPKRLPLTLQQRRKLFREYAKGASPSEIASSHRELGLTSKQIQNLICKEGWAKRKSEIAEVRERSIEEVLEAARKEAAGDFDAFLRSAANGLKIDAEKLEDGWGLVGDAAGASALMRSKKLLLSRAYEFFGVPPSQAPDNSANRNHAISVVFAQFPTAEPATVGIQATTSACVVPPPDALTALDEESDDLDFDDSDHSSENDQ